MSKRTKTRKKSKVRKGLSTRGKRKVSLSKKQSFKLLVLTAKISRIFHKLSQEKRHILKFSSIFLMGHILLLIGGMNLHNNFVILVLLGMTSIIFAISVLGKDLENNRLNENSDDSTDSKITKKEDTLIAYPAHNS